MYFEFAWCLAGGEVVACELNTFNFLADQSLASACRTCGPYTHTRQTGTVWPADCICDDTFQRIEPPAALADTMPATCECAAGSEINYDSGSAACSPCNRGFFKTAGGNSACERCPDLGGQVTTIESGATSITSCVCAPNYYMKDGSCVQCDPVSVDCTLPGTTLYTLPLRPGHWRVNHLHWLPQTTTVQSGTVSDVIHSCYSESACTGTNNQTPGMLLFTDNASRPCAEGHKGTFCGACNWPEYRMNSDTDRCELCEGSSAATLAASIGAVSIVVFGLLLGGLAMLCCPICCRSLLEEANQPMTKEELLAELEPVLNRYLKRLGLTLDQVMPAIELVDSKEELQDAINNPGVFLDRVVRTFAAILGPVVLMYLRPRLLRMMKGMKLHVKLPPPLKAEDLWKALELIDTVEELQEAVRDPKAFLKRLLGCSVAAVSLRAAVHLALPRIREPVTPYLTTLGLMWEDVVPALELIDSVDELREALANPDGFLERLASASTPAVKRLLIAKLKPPLTPSLTTLGLTWEDVVPALELIDSIDELREAIAYPQGFLERLADGSTLVAKRMLIAKLKPPLTPFLMTLGLAWEDVVPALELIDSADEIREAIANPQGFLERLADGSTLSAKRMLVTLARPQLEPHLTKAGLTWEDVVPALELIESAFEVRQVIENPVAFTERFEAVIKMQACWRRADAKKLASTIPLQKQAATRLQSSFRRRKAMRLWAVSLQQHREDTSATKVQRAWNRRLDKAAGSSPKEHDGTSTPAPSPPAVVQRPKPRGLTASLPMQSPPPSPPAILPKHLHVPSRSSKVYPSGTDLKSSSRAHALKPLKPNRKRSWCGRQCSRCSSWASRHARSLGVRARILIAMFQVLSGIGIVYDIPYPDSYGKLLQWLGTIELDFIDALPIGCLINVSFHLVLLVRTIAPLSLIILFKVTGSAVRPWSSKTTDACETAAFFIMFLVYPSCSQYVFATWQCVPLEDGTRWLRRDLSIDCDSPEHILMSLFAVGMFLVYPVGIPSYFAYQLLWNHGAGLDELQRREARAQAHTQLRNTAASQVLLEDKAVVRLQGRMRSAMAKTSVTQAKEALTKRPSHAREVQQAAGGGEGGGDGGGDGGGGIGGGGDGGGEAGGDDAFDINAVYAFDSNEEDAASTIQSSSRLHAVSLPQQKKANRQVVRQAWPSHANHDHTSQPSPQPSLPPSPPSSPARTLWQKQRSSILTKGEMSQKRTERIQRRAQQDTAKLSSMLMKGVTNVDSVRDLARDGKMGVSLPASVLKMTEGYEFRVYWFEIIECFRKLALTGMPVWFEMGSVAQLSFGLLICFFSFGAYMLLSPYAKHSDDRLAQLCQAQTFFALVVAIILNDAEKDGPTDRNMGTLLCVLTALPVVFAFWIEMYGDDPKRSKERMVLSIVKRFLWRPIFDWLMGKRAKLEQTRLEKERGHKALVRVRSSQSLLQRSQSLLMEPSKRTSKTSGVTGAGFKGLEVSKGYALDASDDVEAGSVNFVVASDNRAMAGLTTNASSRLSASTPKVKPKPQPHSSAAPRVGSIDDVPDAPLPKEPTITAAVPASNVLQMLFEDVTEPALAPVPVATPVKVFAASATTGAWAIAKRSAPQTFAMRSEKTQWDLTRVPGLVRVKKERFLFQGPSGGGGVSLVAPHLGAADVVKALGTLSNGVARMKKSRAAREPV